MFFVGFLDMRVRYEDEQNPSLVCVEPSSLEIKLVTKIYKLTETPNMIQYIYREELELYFVSCRKL